MLALAAATPAVSQAPAKPDVIGPQARIQAPGAGHHWPDFETYVYEVEWRIWTAGTATLRLEPGANGERKVMGTADSTGFVSLLYTVRDRFESGFDTKSFCSTHVFKHTEEGFRKRETNIRFDYARGKSILIEKNLRSGEAKHVENDIPACVTDVLSGIYYLGSLPLQPGATYTLPLNDGSKTQTLDAKVEEREEVKVPAGKFRAIRVQPAVSSGEGKPKGKVWIWYSDDEAHIPVQMRARMFWGTLTFRLQRIERQQTK